MFDNFFNESVDNFVTSVMNNIRNDLKIIESKNIHFDYNDKFGLIFNLKINIEKLNKIPIYNANISVKEMLQKKLKDFDIFLIIEDDNIDMNKVYSLISHEISHYHQLVFDPDGIYFESFMKMINIEDFKNKVDDFKNDFLNRIYYNFQHELDARINQTYEAYRFKGKNFDELWKDFLNGDLNKILTYMKYFNVNDLLQKWDNKLLLELTNQFNILYGLQEIKINELSEYHNKWYKVFVNNSNKYLEESKNVIKMASNDVERYEKKDIYCYDTRLMESVNYDIDEEIRKLIKKFKEIK